LEPWSAPLLAAAFAAFAAFFHEFVASTVQGYLRFAAAQIQ